MADCGSCLHSTVQMLDPEPGDETSAGPALLCRRFPPVVFVLEGVVTQTWPQVSSEDRCGEWRSYD